MEITSFFSVSPGSWLRVGLVLYKVNMLSLLPSCLLEPRPMAASTNKDDRVPS